MSDFTHEFWHLYIAILTIASIIGCACLLWTQSKIKVEKKPGQDEASDGTTGHVWDENLTELNTPMPRWWIILFYLTIVFALLYLFLYPGLGHYQGSLHWTADNAYQSEINKANREYDPIFEAYLKQDVKTVAANPDARLIGERLFLNYCAQCHGSDARGSKGFPNLTDSDWLYGGDPETIKATIRGGRHGMMPPMAAAVGSDKAVEEVANYVLSLSHTTHDPVKAVLGKPTFMAVCAACHGANGAGNHVLGAPNLTDKIWLYGGSLQTIMETIQKGRSNTMPAFGELLGEAKIHVLTAYVWGLSHPEGLENK